MYSVDIYSWVRRACLKDGMSAREAARHFNKDRKTIAKMLRHEDYVFKVRHHGTITIGVPALISFVFLLMMFSPPPAFF